MVSKIPLAIALLGCVFQFNHVQAVSDTPTQNYAEALHKSYLFYEAQRSGPLPKQRLAWRSDSCTECWGPNGEDLRRGYYEAANTMKWGFPYAFMITQNAWNAIEFEDGMRKANQFKQAKEMVKWGTDYLIGAYSSYQYNDKYLSDEEFVNQFKFVGHMGNSDIDFEYFGPPEEFDEWAHRNRIPKNLRRPVYYVDKENPSSEICGESAAAMAAGAILLKEDYPDYANDLINRAKSLLRFAIAWQGNYKDSGLLGFKQAFVWYPSTSFIDEIAWGAAWIYRASGESKYLDLAQQFYEQGPGKYGGWGYSWAEKGPGVHLIMLKVNGPTPDKYIRNARQYFDSWMPGDKQTVEHTPGGLGYIYHWGANRYAANTAMLCLVMRKFMMTGVTKPDAAYQEKLLNYGASQVNYLLGENPEGYSWMVGYGSYYPKRPYHKSSYNSILNYPLRECPCVTTGCDCYYEEYCDCAWNICKSSGADWEPHRCECKTPTGRICDSIRENEMDFTYGEKPNQHIVYGALVGSPIRDSQWKASDTPLDNRNDYEYTEVTQDYNAGFTGAIAGMAEYYYDYTTPYSDCGLDLGWEHPNAAPRPDWPEDDCYHRCDCTPTIAPTRKPTFPTVKPTPHPTNYCPGEIIDNGWTSCLETPGCCASGLQCFRQNMYWAACLDKCEPYMKAEGNTWQAWECVILTTDNAGPGIDEPSGECDGDTIGTSATNCMDQPGCCRMGTKCFMKDDYWAACKTSCDSYEENYEGKWEPWSCIVLDDDSATPTPEPVGSNELCKSAIIEDGSTNCMYNPTCCKTGTSCFEKNKDWAACLEKCDDYMENDAGGWDHWNCVVLGSPPIATDPPVTPEDCPDNEMIENGSTNCIAKPGCCGSTTKCFQKDEFWAACLETCSEYMENGEGGWDHWQCNVLTESAPTPQPTSTPKTDPPVTPADCSSDVITDGSTNCKENPNCCAVGTRCYAKDGFWAACFDKCETWMQSDSGEWEEWECSVLGGDTSPPIVDEDCEDGEMIESAANNCMYKPNCCAAGTVCYEKDEWWAACLDSCSNYMDNGNGGYDHWNCVVLTTAITDSPAASPVATNAPVVAEVCDDGEEIITSKAVNCMYRPGCCADGTECYMKNQWWAACMDVCDDYQLNNNGEWDKWACEIMLVGIPTSSPIAVQTDPPVQGGDCENGVIESGGTNCMYNPGCCANGKRCYEKNKWWAACLNSCDTWMKADSGAWEEWSCTVLTNDAPAETDAPTSKSSCSSGSLIEDASINCMDSPDCCKVGTCYQKNQWWAACLPECMEWMSFDNGNTWEYWECLMLEKDEGDAPTPSPSNLPAYCPTQSFVKPVRDCTSEPDCCPAGTFCFLKTQGWAECLTQCEAGMVDAWNNTPWECKKLNRENQVCDHIHQEYSEDCSASPNCCPSGTKCYRKSEWWASCRSDCTPGEVDSSGYSQPWDCGIIEGQGADVKYSLSSGAPWFGTVVETPAPTAVTGSTASLGPGAITLIVVGALTVVGSVGALVVRNQRLKNSNSRNEIQSGLNWDVEMDANLKDDDLNEAPESDE